MNIKVRFVYFMVVTILTSDKSMHKYIVSFQNIFPFREALHFEAMADLHV